MELRNRGAMPAPLAIYTAERVDSFRRLACVGGGVSRFGVSHGLLHRQDFLLSKRDRGGEADIRIEYRQAFSGLYISREESNDGFSFHRPRIGHPSAKLLLYGFL